MRMIKYQLHTGLNTIPTTSSQLKLVYMDYQERKLFGWFCETQTTAPDSYQVYVAVTGETLNNEYRYVTSTQTTLAGGYYVLHAFD